MKSKTLIRFLIHNRRVHYKKRVPLIHKHLRVCDKLKLDFPNKINKNLLLYNRA